MRTYQTLQTFHLKLKHLVCVHWMDHFVVIYVENYTMHLWQLSVGTASAQLYVFHMFPRFVTPSSNSYRAPLCSHNSAYELPLPTNKSVQIVGERPTKRTYGLIRRWRMWYLLGKLQGPCCPRNPCTFSLLTTARAYLVLPDPSQAFCPPAYKRTLTAGRGGQQCDSQKTKKDDRTCVQPGTCSCELTCRRPFS